MTRKLGIAPRDARPRGAARERGTMALEMVILAPILLILFMFLLACGRYFQTSSLLESAARDGARSASQSRSLGRRPGPGRRRRSRGTMDQAVKSCKDTAAGTITTAFTAGSPLSVEVTCTINYRDLGLLGHRWRHHDHQAVHLVPRPVPGGPRWRPLNDTASPDPRVLPDRCSRQPSARRRPGALSPAVAILAVMIFTLAGLVIDGGRQLGAKSRAVGYAQEAARVGAATIQLNNAEAKIDTTKAAHGDRRVLRPGDVERPGGHLLRATEADRRAGRDPGRHRQQDDLPRHGRQAEPDSQRHRPGPRRTRRQEGRRQPDDPADRRRHPTPTTPARRPAPRSRRPSTCRARPGPIGSPTPTWTLTPFPFPATCSPNVTPTRPDPLRSTRPSRSEHARPAVAHRAAAVRREFGTVRPLRDRRQCSVRCEGALPVASVCAGVRAGCTSLWPAANDGGRPAAAVATPGRRS